jgi:hypothetical protein
MTIDIRNPSVDPGDLFSNFMVWLDDDYRHLPVPKILSIAYPINSQINALDLKHKIYLWAGLPIAVRGTPNDDDIEMLLYCWVKLGFLEAFGFDGAHAPWVYVLRRIPSRDTLDNQPH